MKFYVDIDSSDPTHVTLDNNGNVIANNQTDAEKKMRKPINASKTDLLQSWWTDPGDTNGRWNVIIPGITADNLVDGLTIRIRLSTSYNSTFNTLNVNGLGPKVVYYRYNSRLTSHVGQWAEILLTYHTATSVVSTNGNTYTLNGAAASAYVNNNVNYGTDGWILDYAYSDGNNYDRILSNYERRYVGTNGLFKNTLAMIEDNGRISSIVTTESNGTSKVANPAHFRPDRILFYNGTSQSGTNKVSGAQNLYEAIPTTSAANIINESLTTYSDLYFVGTLDDNGYFVFDNTNTTSYYKVVSNSAAVPANTFVEGKYYIYVGASYSTANYLQLMPSHQLFFCQDTNGQKLTAVTPLATALINPKVNKYVATQTAGTEIGKITLDNIESTLYYGKPNAFVWTTNSSGQLILNLSMSDSASVAAPVMPAASTTQNGALTHTTQTVAGNKFTSGTHVGMISGGEKDQFFDFAYAADPTASTAPGASWRIGALNSGSSDTNYFVIQSGGSSTSATEWKNALRIGMNTFDIAVGGNLYSSATTNTKTLGTSSARWKAVYIGTADSYGSAYVPIYWNAGVPKACSSPSMLVNLGSTSADTIFKASPSPGIKGTLGTANGGTGNTSYTKGRVIWAETATKLAGAPEMHINWSAGTTSTIGYEELVIGNTTASGNEGNAIGRIALYSSSTKGSYITAAATSASTWPNHVLPATAGWLVTAGNGSSTGAGSAYVPIYVSTAGIATACSQPSMLVNVGSNTAANVFAASPSPGVTGTLAVGNGGTGVSELTAGYALIGDGTNAVKFREIRNNTSQGALGWTAAATDTTLVTTNTIAYWNGAYQGTTSNLKYLGTVVGGTWQASTIGVAYGGTGLTSSPSMLVDLGSETADTILKASPKPGVDGTLPVKHGGTGATSFTKNCVIMSGSSTTAALTTRAVTNNTSNTAVTNNTNIPTMNTIYYGLAVINNASQTRGVSIYAPTTAGTQNHILVSAGGNDAPIWKNPNEITVGYANKLSPGGEISFQGDTQGTFTYIGTALTPTLTTYSVEGYKMVSKTGSPQSWYKYTMTYTTTTIPTGDWWVKVVLNRSYESWLTPIEIKADYSNRSCKLYWDLDSYNNLWRAYLTSYNQTNIKAIKRAWENSKSNLYIKLEKPTEYGGSTPQGTITVYSPVEIVSIEQLTAEPANLQTLQYGYNSNTVISTSGWGKFATLEVGGVQTKGNSATPIYLENGLIKQCAFSFGASINASGNANRLAYYSAVNTIASGENLYSDGSVLAVNKNNITSGYAFEVAGKTILGSITAGNGTNTHTVYGHVVINPAKDTANSYSEGLRINLGSNSWSTIALGGADSTTSGTGDGIWLVGVNSKNLYLSHNGSSSASTRIQGQSTGFRIYPKLAVNADINSSYQAYINGSLGVNGVIYGIDQTDSSSIGTGSVILAGGLSVGKAVWINSSFNAPNTATLTTVVDKSVALWDGSTLKQITSTDFRDTLLPLTIITCDGGTNNKAKLKVTTSWIDTGITGVDIPENGSYIVQMYVNVTGSGLSHYQEYYTGVMSWFKDGTNSTDYDEIWLHKAGHASNGNNLYLRTIRSSDPGKLKLQISADVTMSAAATFIFKFRKMI